MQNFLLKIKSVPHVVRARRARLGQCGRQIGGCLLRLAYIFLQKACNISDFKKPCYDMMAHFMLLISFAKNKRKEKPVASSSVHCKTEMFFSWITANRMCWRMWNLSQKTKANWFRLETIQIVKWIPSEARAREHRDSSMNGVIPTLKRSDNFANKSSFEHK